MACVVLAAAVLVPSDRGAARPLQAAAVAADASVSGQWGSLMSWPLVSVHASLLHTGQVITWDAWETGGTHSVRLWDPSTDTFTPVPNETTQIFCSGQAQLPDGRLLVIGGHDGGEVGIDAVNAFDPVTEQWSLLSDMNSPRWYPSATELASGQVMAISGQETPGVYADTPELYSPASDTWTELTGASSRFVHDDGYPLSYLLPNGRLFVFDPEGGSLGILDPAAGTFSAGPSSPIRFGSAAMYLPGKILVSGGGSGWNAPTTAGSEVIDMNQANPTWQATAPMADGRYQHTLVVLADGQVLAIGGSSDVNQADVNGPLPAELWSPQTQAWTTVASTTDPRMYHSTALLLPDGTVLAAGGGRFSTATNYPTAEIYSPPYLFKGARPTITSAPATAAYGATMTVQTPDAASVGSVALVGLGSITHTLDMDQRYVPLTFAAGSGSLGVQTPASANLAPPGYYMLFILNSAGVPSVAKFVQLSANPDTQAPAVSVTAPAAGATLSGTSVSLQASAHDDVGVAAVQFQVDGAAAGPRVTAPPFTQAWDSTSVGDGTHTVTAEAWDAAGNSSTSPGVSVSVSNPAPPGISTIQATGVGSSGATVSWATDKDADSQVDYGTTSSYGSATTLDQTLTRSHTRSLTGLAASTTYHFQVRSRDANGRLSVSADQTLTTGAALPAFRSASSVTDGTTVAAPAGVAAGDLLLASLEVDADPVTVTGPPGWTQVVDRAVGQTTPSAFHSQLWYHLAGASEPSSYHFTTSVSAWTDIGLLDYQDVDGGAPIDVFSARDAGVTATPATDSVTTSTPDDMVVALFQDFSYGTWTTGSGMTGRYDFDSNTAEDALQAAPGATGARTATNTRVGQSSAMIVALAAKRTDAQPPSVTVTAPAAGATVSGSVGLAATASDNVGVTGLQFTVDGQAVGPRLTSAPYTYLWDSTTVANGAHTIGAQASDGAGNSATAQSVGVTVSNGAPPVISNVAATQVTSTGATITWTTSTPATSQVDYGTTSGYGSSTALDSTAVTSHSQTLSGLVAGTPYHFRVESATPAGPLATSGDMTFTTAGSAPSTPGFRSASTAIGSSAARPAGVQAGDLLLASLEIDGDPVTVTPPAGWTLLQDVRSAVGTPSVFHQQLWYRLAGSAEPATYQWSVAGSPYVDLGIVAYSNVSQATPIDTSAARDAGTTNQPVAPALTTTSDHDLVVAAFANFKLGRWTAGAGMTKRYDFDSNLAEDGAAGPAGTIPGRTATNTASGPTTAVAVAIEAP